MIKMQKTKEILKKVRTIEIKTNRLVEGLLQGAYHSVFKGRGIEFSEVREYVPGDDIRTIDWNVTARMNFPYIKEFIEERDLTIYIVLDVSASNKFGYEETKKQKTIELSASLMFSALKNNDNIGLCLFTDKVEKFIPPRKGKKHVLKLIREMIQFTPESSLTEISSTLSYLSKIIKRKGIIFIISDFFADKPFEKELRLLKNKHDVVAININDIRESEIPDIGYIELEDEETGEQILVNTSNKFFRENYAKMSQEKDLNLKNLFKKLKIDVIQLKTNEPFEINLRKFFKIRQNRMAR